MIGPLFDAGFQSGQEAAQAEIARLRASNAELLGAAQKYRDEFNNPVPDYVMRRSLRERLFEAIANAEKEGK